MAEYYNKIFLTQEDDGGASVMWSTKYDDAYEWGNEANLLVRDCGRQVTLEFPHYNSAIASRSLRKIDNFIAALNLFREDFSRTLDKKKPRYY